MLTPEHQEASDTEGEAVRVVLLLHQPIKLGIAAPGNIGFREERIANNIGDDTHSLAEIVLQRFERDRRYLSRGPCLQRDTKITKLLVDLQCLARLRTIGD